MIDTQVSHYRLVRKLGAGTYGEVYEGVHVHDEQLRVAVKVARRLLFRVGPRALSGNVFQFKRAVCIVAQDLLSISFVL